MPGLLPESLHQIVRDHGLEACGALIAAATPTQLGALLDLDLWSNAQPGVEEQFNAERFGEWVEALVETEPGLAAGTMAAIDANLVIAGLSRYVRVFDLATVEREPVDGLSFAMGGYLLRARTTEAWDAILVLLAALADDQLAFFHTVMRGCRRLSNSVREIDGLDELRMEPEQLLHDLAAGREQRRTHQGYITPADARAFLDTARRPPDGPPGGRPPNPIAAAYFRGWERTGASDNRPGRATRAAASPTDSDEPTLVHDVVELLALSGVVAQGPLALLEESDKPPPTSRLRILMDYVRDGDPSAYARRAEELAFLANTLMAGCTLLARPFTLPEASDAVVATCNLGLANWPAPPGPGDPVPTNTRTGPDVPDAFFVDHDVVSVFELGWARLHEDVSMFVAQRLIQAVVALRCADPETRSGLQVLRRELVRQRDAGTPWRAHDALDVMAILDMPVWHSLLGLLSECPVLPEVLTATLEGRTGAISATSLAFIATGEQIGTVRAFMDRLVDLLSR